MSKVSALEHELPEQSSISVGDEVRDLELTICKEWRSFSASVITGGKIDLDLSPAQHEKTWNLLGRVHSQDGKVEDANEDINCKLLVGFYGARDLPSDMYKYWCKVSCTNATNFSGGGPREERTEKETWHVKGSSCSTWRYPPLGGDDRITMGQHESSKIDEDEECGSNRVEVIWEQPKFFHFHSMREVELTVELFCSAKKKPLGSIMFDPSCLCMLNSFSEVVDWPLTDLIPGLTKVPSVRIMFQLWLLERHELWDEGSRSAHLVADVGRRCDMRPLSSTGRPSESSSGSDEV